MPMHQRPGNNLGKIRKSDQQNNRLTLHNRAVATKRWCLRMHMRKLMSRKQGVIKSDTNRRGRQSIMLDVLCHRRGIAVGWIRQLQHMVVMTVCLGDMRISDMVMVHMLVLMSIMAEHQGDAVSLNGHRGLMVLVVPGTRSPSQTGHAAARPQVGEQAQQHQQAGLQVHGSLEVRGKDAGHPSERDKGTSNTNGEIALVLASQTLFKTKVGSLR